MAFTDFSATISTIDATLAIYEELDRAPSLFTQFGDTLQHFQFRGVPFKGKSYHYRVKMYPASPVKREKYSTANTTAFPAPRSSSWQEMSYPKTDLLLQRATARFNTLADEASQDSQYSVIQTAEESIADAYADMAVRYNLSLHGSARQHICQISGIYDIDGTSFSGAAASASALIAIKNGPISAFQRGMILDIYDSGTTTQKNATVKVLDVGAGPDGPWLSGSRATDVGAWIVVEPCDSTGDITAGSNWNATDTPAANDYIASSGEFNYASPPGSGFPGFESLFDPTVNIYKDGDGNAIDRDTDGYRALVPPTFGPSSSTTFDMETHIGEVADYLPTRVRTAKMKEYAVNNRTDMDGNPYEIRDSIVAVANVPLINYIIQEAQDSARFLFSPLSTMDEAARRKIIGDVGSDGIVYHNQTLGNVVFQPDPMCAEETIYMIEPNSCYLIGKDGEGSSLRPRFVRNASGGRVHTVTDSSSDNRLTYYAQAGMWVEMGLIWDQPGLNVRIQNVSPA